MKINLENKNLNFNARFASNTETKNILRKFMHLSSPVSVYYAIHALQQAEPNDIISLKKHESKKDLNNDEIEIINENINNNKNRIAVPINLFLQNLLNLQLSNGKSVKSYTQNDSFIEFFYTNKKAEEELKNKSGTFEIDKKIKEYSEQIQQLETQKNNLIKQSLKSKYHFMDNLIDLL